MPRVINYQVLLRLGPQTWKSAVIIAQPFEIRPGATNSAIFNQWHVQALLNRCSQGWFTSLEDYLCLTLLLTI